VPGQKQDLHQIAERLRGIASDIDKTPQIDEPSTEIRKRLVELFNKRASTIDSAGKGDKALVQTESEEAERVFDDYFSWEDSVLDKYGLVRGKK
jgi:hypothetical protein